MFFCLGQYGALRAIAERLLPGEIRYVVCQLEGVGDVHIFVEQELWRHAKISVRVKCGTVEERAPTHAQH